MKKWPNILKTLLAILFVSCVSTSGVYAAVAYPQLDIHGLEDSLFSNGTSLTISASVIGIITAEVGVTTPFDPFVDFLLTVDDLENGTGSLIAGAMADPLLTATFSNFTLYKTLFGSNFSADLSYTGGSMQGGLAGGSITGAFENADPADFSVTAPFAPFTADNVTAKIGPVTVVPVPAAVWLFGSGLIGLVSMARKRVG